MRKRREVLRLKWVLGRSHREIARSLGMGVGTVSECVARARAAGVDWAAAEALGDDELEARLYPSGTARSRPLPDPVYLDKELRRPGVNRPGFPGGSKA